MNTLIPSLRLPCFRLLPGSRMGRVRLGLLFVLLIGLGCRMRLDRVAMAGWGDKREGDIVFQSLPRGPLVTAIEGVTGSEWSHCGVLMRKDGRWHVAEALGEVIWTPYWQWVARGRGSKVAVYRVNGLPGTAPDALRRELLRLTGRPYDFRYAPGDDEVYCSELVWLAYERGAGIRLGEWERLGDLNWRPHEDFIREMEAGAPPLERRMITPVALTRSPLVRQVHPAP